MYKDGVLCLIFQGYDLILIEEVTETSYNGRNSLCLAVRNFYGDRSMSEDNGYKLQPAVKGISENEANNWEQFYNLIFQQFCQEKGGNKKKPYINDYVWRGHRCESWKLKSLFDRDGFRSDLRRHLNSFAYACRGKLKEFDTSIRELKRDIRERNLHENHIWVLCQHYGFKTPLLDWCYSPFVAAFFAFEKKTIAEDFAEDKLKEICSILGSNGSIAKKDFVEELKKRAEKRTVIGLNVKLLKKLREKELCIHTHRRQEDTNPHEHKREIDHTFHFHQRGDQERRHRRRDDDFPTLDYFDPMSSENPRLINQRGLFTITKNGEDIEEIVRKNWAKGEENEPPWIVKILIPNNNNNRDNRVEFLRELNLMNINHMTLFPEIEGAAKFCNIGIEDGLDDYAVFHGQGV